MKSRTKYVLIDCGTEVGDQPRGLYHITRKKKTIHSASKILDPWMKQIEMFSNAKRSFTRL